MKKNKYLVKEYLSSDAGHHMVFIILGALAFILVVAVIVMAQRPSIPSQSPIGGGWTDDGTVVRLTTETDNIGVGTDAPSAKLDIIGKIKISDGTEGTGKVLTSDVTGLASWQAQPAGIGGNVSGNGTTNFIPIWTTGSSLGDSIMKIDGSGNLIFKPGKGIILISPDGTSKCRKIVVLNAGDPTPKSIIGVHILNISCPPF